MTALDVLFISGDLGGNVPPTVAIAEELARRGHRVAVAGILIRRGDRIPSGLMELPLPALADIDVTRKPGWVGLPRAAGRITVGGAVARDVGALLAGRPVDVVVVDGAMLSAIREVLASGIPTAALFHTFGQLWNEGLGNGALNALLRPFGVAPRALFDRADARLLATDPVLDPAGNGSSRFAFEWLGTTERGVPTEPRTPGEPALVLVSLSTVWLKNQGDVYRRIVAALGQLDRGEPRVRGIVTTGGVQFTGNLRPLPNVEIRGRAPHGEILPRADLVIGHGGHATTMRALAHGVPLLIMPTNPLSDQPMIGKVVESPGLGRTLHRNAKPEAIRDAVRGILNDREIREAAARTGERLRAQRGADVGADRIEALAGTP
ncbi:glycosyltransferase [Lysobacter korlensis]|uniref:Glycosyltransferase n=1 Tax=Lysobacter korlensis TaxID=553636 RepID=A0ABV6RXN8_9GAMM